MMLAAFHGWACAGINCELGANVSCSDASMQSAPGGEGGTQAVDLALSLELAYSNGPCPQVRRAITVVASASALSTLAAVEGKGPGAANHSKINMLVVRRSWGFPYFRILLWSFNFLAGMSPAESAPK
jgi:hypothetical protein